MFTYLVTESSRLELLRSHNLGITKFLCRPELLQYAAQTYDLFIDLKCTRLGLKATLELLLVMNRVESL